MSDEPEKTADDDGIDKVFQAGLIALVFRARKIGLSRERFLDMAGHAFDMGDRHGPTLQKWLEFGGELVQAVKTEARRQRGGT
jgi:hypothetical protein